MSPRSTGFLLTVCATAFFCGWRLALWPTTPHGIVTTLVVCGLVVALVATSLLPDPGGDYAASRRAVMQIRDEIVNHLNNGVEILAPNNHSKCASVLIPDCDSDGVVSVTQWPITGAGRQYYVTPTFVLGRRLIRRDGLPFTDAELTWCHGPMTSQRLRGVVTALTDSGLYVPRKACARRR